MSKKKTPQEKKQAEYERKNYVSFHHAKSTRKSFRVKKRLAAKKLRSETRGLTAPASGVDCETAASELEGVTADLIRSGLTRKRIVKFNVLSLKEKVAKRTEARRR